MTLKQERPLTQGREDFAVNIVKGIKPQWKAYKLAFPDDTSSVKTLTENASELLVIPNVAARIDELRNKAVAPAIADSIERQTFWSTTMRNNAEKTVNQLRASELLGKRQGDFVEKVEINVETKALIVRLEAHSIEELDTMMAELREQRRALE